MSYNDKTIKDRTTFRQNQISLVKDVIINMINFKATTMQSLDLIHP